MLRFENLKFIENIKFYNFDLLYNDEHPCLELSLFEEKENYQQWFTVIHYEVFDPEAPFEDLSKVNIWSFESYHEALEWFTNKLIDLLP